jgi:hypothetical protein
MMFDLTGLEPNVQAYSPAFQAFWAVYPRKVGKPEAFKAFRRAYVSAVLLEAMIAALDWQAQQPAWQESGGRFIPHPATWINQRRWEDEPVAVTPARPRSLGPQYHGWECPHDPACEQRHWCDLKTAKAEAGL